MLNIVYDMASAKGANCTTSNANLSISVDNSGLASL